jgi:hypothetical protein
MSARGWRVAIVAGWGASLVCAFVAAACGGRVGSEPGQSGLSADEGGSTELLDGGAEVSLLDTARMDSAVEADAASCVAVDASVCVVALSCAGAAIPPYAPPINGAFVFEEPYDLIAYFVNLAQVNGLVVPAHGVDCHNGQPDGSSCSYDPLMPQLDASDIHYSTPSNQFVGPDGDPYVWWYFPNRNYWVVVDGNVAPTTYAFTVQYNECLLD